MSSEHTEILEFNQHQKSDEALFVIYADLDSFIENIDGCKTNPEKSSTTKVREHIPSGFLMSTISSFKSIENKHGVYKIKDCMKKFCAFLREHVMKIFDFKKKKMKLLTKELQESRKNANICYICIKSLKINMWKIKNIKNLEIIVIIQGEHIGAAHSICNL